MHMHKASAGGAVCCGAEHAWQLWPRPHDQSCVTGSAHDVGICTRNGRGKSCSGDEPWLSGVHVRSSETQGVAIQ